MIPANKADRAPIYGCLLRSPSVSLSSRVRRASSSKCLHACRKQAHMLRTQRCDRVDWTSDGGGPECRPDVTRSMFSLWMEQVPLRQLLHQLQFLWRKRLPLEQPASPNQLNMHRSSIIACSNIAAAAPNSAAAHLRVV